MLARLLFYCPFSASVKGINRVAAQSSLVGALINTEWVVNRRWQHQTGRRQMQGREWQKAQKGLSTQLIKAGGDVINQVI